LNFKKLSYFDKYLDAINNKNRYLKKYEYYIKVPAKYDLKFWLLAALKKKLFDIDTPKTYYNLSKKEASDAEIQRMRFGKYKGGILIFANDLDFTKRYSENFHEIFHNRTIHTILEKYSDGVVWSLGKTYRGVYKNKHRNKNFNAMSNTLEILGVNSVDLINIAVKLSVQFQQSIVLIKDLNNEQMVILGKNFEPKKKVQTTIDLTDDDEVTDYKIAALEAKLNDHYRLCPASQHTLWDMYAIYPGLNYFWIAEDGNWYGK
jgi:hypothetical protein